MVRSLLFILLALLFSSALSEAAKQPETAIVSRIKRQPVESTALAAIGYSKRLRALEIEFVNGAIYRYLHVPPSLYQDFLFAYSKAGFYHKNVRGRFLSLRVRKWRTYHRPRPSLGLERAWPSLYNDRRADVCPDRPREKGDLLRRFRAIARIGHETLPRYASAAVVTA